MAKTALLAHLENVVLPVRMDLKDHLVPLALLAQQDLLVKLGQLGNQVHRALRVSLVTLDVLGNREKKVLQVRLVLKGSQEFLVKVDCQDFLVKEDCLVCLECQV